MLTSSQLAPFLDVTEAALRKRVSRGRFPQQDEPGGWSVAHLLSNELLLDPPAEAIIPPHWRAGSDASGRFIEMRPVSRGAVALIADVTTGDRRRPLRIALIYRSFDGPRLSTDLQALRDTDFVYWLDNQYLTRPYLRYAPLDASHRTLEDEASGAREVWTDLSSVLGFALPWWEPRLRSMDAMLFWRPGHEMALVRPIPEEPTITAAVRTLIPAVDDPDQVLSRYERMIDCRWPITSTFGDGATDLVVAAIPDMPECDEATLSVSTSDIENLRLSGEVTDALASSAALLLAGSSRIWPNGPLKKGQPLVDQMLSQLPKDPDPTFGRTLLALAATCGPGGSHQPVDRWFRISGSDGYLGERGDQRYAVVLPTTIDISEPLAFELPVVVDEQSQLPMVIDGSLRAVPVPAMPFVSNYTVGYRGSGPRAFALACARLLAGETGPWTANSGIACEVPEATLFNAFAADTQPRSINAAEARRLLGCDTEMFSYLEGGSGQG